MLGLTAAHVVGLILTLVAITGVGLWSGSKVKNASDFTSGGGRAGAVIVAGTIMGTLVGGASTIATAQLAYTFGLSAWWFTLGAGIGCLILALGFVKPLRANGSGTLTGVIGKEYGSKTGMVASVLSSIGMFINIIAQIISGTAVLDIVFPDLSTLAVLLIVTLLMIVYVIFGGVWGTGLVGLLKLGLIYMAVIWGAIIALHLSGGLSAFLNNPELPRQQFFNLFARGVGTDGGAALSLVLGVLSTQTYAQACLSGRSDSAARKGALASAVMMPTIGMGGILIGLFMRTHHPALEQAKAAFPEFVLTYMPDFVGGVVMATLLIAVVGTGAGLALGISTIMSRDLLKLSGERQKKYGLIVNRGLIVLVLGLACLMSFGSLGDMILDFSFMSMGLRGAVVFVPMCFALFQPGRVKPAAAMAAVVAGPLIVLIGNFLPLGFDPLFIGMAAALVIMFLGRKKNPL